MAIINETIYNEMLKVFDVNRTTFYEFEKTRLLLWGSVSRFTIKKYINTHPIHTKINYKSTFTITNTKPLLSIQKSINFHLICF